MDMETAHTGLRGKVVLITGAASGIGAACARKFASLGCKLALADLTNPCVDGMKQCLEGTLKDSELFVELGNLTDQQFRERFVANVCQHFGSIDVLVNCAGVIGGSSILHGTATMTEFHREFDINVIAPMALCQLCIPHLLKSKGCIVNVESVSAFFPSSGKTFYCMSKAALYSMTNCLAQELGPLGVRVNAVDPGPVDTALLKKSHHDEFPDMTDAEFLEHKQKMVSPLGAICKPADVADSIAFLASENARFITGQHLGINCKVGLK